MLVFTWLLAMDPLSKLLRINLETDLNISTVAILSQFYMTLFKFVERINRC